jgi:hypothetical protein
MATSRRSDLEHGSRAFSPDRPLFGTPTRRNAAKAFSRTFSSPQTFLIAAFLLCIYTLISSHRATGPEGLDALLPRSRSAFGLEDPALLTGPPSTLVIYDYQGLDEEDLDNLRFFLALGVAPDDGNRYIIIAQEKLLHEDEQDEDGALEDEALGLPEEYPLPPLEGLPSNIQIIPRPNEPCRSSWGVLGWLLYADVLDMSVFQNFILVDSSVRGPFLPAHWPPIVHWSAALLSRLHGTVHMVGATISTDPTHPGPGAPLAALTRVQPRVRSGVVAFDHIALQAIQTDPDALKCRAGVEDAAWFNEAGASAAVLHSGLNLDCLMLRYQNKDWLDKSSWGWKESNSDVDSGPFQVMFVPLRSKTLASSRAAFAAHQYSMWAIKALRAASGTGESDAPVKTTTKAPTVKKATATDTATARMQLDAAAAQAAAMAIRQQREKAAAAELEVQNTINSDLRTQQQQQQQQQPLLNLELENDLVGGLHALDDFDEVESGVDGKGLNDYIGTDILGDFTDDFEGMNSDDVEHGIAATHSNDNSNKINNNLLNNDDYSGADDFNGGVGGGVNDAGGAILEAAEDDYHHRAQQLEQNPFDDRGDLETAAAHAAGVA